MILGDIGQSIALDSALILTVDSDGLYLIALLGGNAYRYAAPILDRHAAVGIGRTAATIIEASPKTRAARRRISSIPGG